MALISDGFLQDNNSVWISASNNSSNPTGWVITFLDCARKFGTGPPTYTRDDYVIDSPIWEPGIEP